MQNDLISRSALIEELQKYFINNTIHKNDLAEVIANIPTAYNVEKVMAELEEQKCEYEKIFNRLKYEVPNQAIYYLGLHSGCEISEHIVRNGGKE